MILNIRGVFLNGAAVPAGTTPKTPSEQRVSWPLGADGSVIVTIVDPTGAPVNLTGASFVLGLRAATGDASPIFTRTGSIVDAANGIAAFTLVAADTSGLSQGQRCRYDVWMVLAGLRNQIVLASDFVIIEADTLPSESGGPATLIPPPGVVDTLSTTGVTLASVDATNLTDGAAVWVREKRRYYHIEVGNGYELDGVLVLTASGLSGGQWVSGLGS